MVKRREIKRISDFIAREFQPQRIILFGSYAYGRPTADSDVDLMVIMPLDGGRALDKAVEISGRLNHQFSIDLLVRSPEEVEQRVKLNDFFLQEVTRKGRVLFSNNQA